MEHTHLCSFLNSQSRLVSLKNTSKCDRILQVMLNKINALKFELKATHCKQHERVFTGTNHVSHKMVFGLELVLNHILKSMTWYVRFSKYAVFSKMSLKAGFH